jgi:uncharacterized membrane protein YoaK (UPF0700 family)
VPAGDASHRLPARLLGLSLAGGSIDAGVYLGLGHVFPANMTGNTVLLAVSVVERSGAQAARSALALGGFCVGAAVGRLLLRGGSRWPARARLTFAFEVAVLAGVLVAWDLVGARPRGPLIAAAGATMGSQSVAVNASGVRGVATTYMTGTLTSAVSRLAAWLRGAEREASQAGLPAMSWLLYGVGALAGALVEHAAHAAVIAVPLLAVTVSAFAGRS